MQSLRHAVCQKGGCETRWMLTKPLEDYQDGPRCPECGSRKVEIEDDAGDDDDLYARAFERFEDGDSPLDLVRSGLCDPQRARSLQDQFNNLGGEYKLFSKADVRKIRKEAAQKGRKRGKAEARQEMNRRMREVREQAFNQGYQQAMNQSKVMNQMSKMKDGF